MAAGMGEGGAGDGVGRSCCPRYLQPTEVTASCGWCHHPHGAPWQSRASWGDTGDGHNPTGSPTPPGQALTIQLAGAATLRGAWKERNTVPRPHSAWGAQRAERRGPARSAPTYLHPPPARSLQRRRAAGLRQRGESGSPMSSSISQHRMEPPKTTGQPQEGFGQGGRVEPEYPTWGGGATEVYPGPSPISTSTSRLQISWKRLNTRQE